MFDPVVISFIALIISFTHLLNSFRLQNKNNETKLRDDFLNILSDLYFIKKEISINMNKVVSLNNENLIKLYKKIKVDTDELEKEMILDVKKVKYTKKDHRDINQAKISAASIKSNLEIIKHSLEEKVNHRSRAQNK